MIIILSPSKTMEWSSIQLPDVTLPIFLKESKMIAGILKKMSLVELQNFLKVSEKLAIQNFERIKKYDNHYNQQNSSPTMFTFTGEVYSGLQPDNFNEDDLKFAQSHLRILSGFYGYLRPLDLMKEYRLEIATKLVTSKATNLYHFWSQQVTKILLKDIKALENNLLINLASDEYYKCLDIKNTSLNIIHFDFYEMRDGKKTFVSFSAKRARGLMAHFIIKNKITSSSSIPSFDLEGYKYHEELSNDNLFTFIKY